MPSTRSSAVWSRRLRQLVAPDRPIDRVSVPACVVETFSDTSSSWHALGLHQRAAAKSRVTRTRASRSMTAVQAARVLGAALVALGPARTRPVTREPRHSALLRPASLGLVLAALSCASEEPKPNYHNVPSGAVCAPGSALTYDNFGRKFMEDYCLRCHSKNVVGPDRKGAPSDHNLDELGEARAFSDHIDEHAAAGPDRVNEYMPTDDPKPSLAERQQLGEWLACGAP